MAELNVLASPEPFPTRQMIIFDPNSDAVATNRGFLVQFLETVEAWVRAFGTQRIIYCERYDDIYAYDPEQGESHFRQIKSYWSGPLGVNDEPVRHTLYLFYLNATRFPLEKCTFTLVIDGTLRPKDVLLKAWMKASDTGRIDSTTATVAAKTLQNIVKEELLTRYKKAQQSGRYPEAELKARRDKALAIMRNFNFAALVRAIRVEVSEARDVSNRINRVTRLIESSLHTPVPSKVVLARCVTEVIKASSENAPEKRQLTSQHLSNLLQEDEATMCGDAQVQAILQLQIEPILAELKENIERAHMRIDSIEGRLGRALAPEDLLLAVHRLTEALQEQSFPEPPIVLPMEIADKITLNELSSKVTSTIRESIIEFQTIDQFLQSGLLPQRTVRSIPGWFRAYYQKRNAIGEKCENIFWDLVHTITPLDASLEQEMTSRTLVSYYFTACEVGENVNSK